MSKEVTKALAWSSIISMGLAVLIVIGSRNLAHFDAALVAYTASTLFATFGIVYRYTMWLQRPPTAMYWKRGWQTFLNPRHLVRNLLNWPGLIVNNILTHRFIFRRSRMRGITHLMLLWGGIIGIAITFPLVFGWLHFENVPGDLHWYQAYVFGFPTFTFEVDSLVAFILFHGLVWSAILIMAGTMLAMRRRMREEGAVALQNFAEDILPLIILFSTALTGAMLTISYTWLRGYAYDFISIIHAITVIGAFVYLPFGKFFHIFQRPAQLGVNYYKQAGEEGEAACCRRCGTAFSSQLHIKDLIETEKALGYHYEMPDSPVEHYQWICPPCRRAMFTLAQGAIWRQHRGGSSTTLPGYKPTTPQYANPALGEGPLGREDANNFHA